MKIVFVVIALFLIIWLTQIISIILTCVIHDRNKLFEKDLHEWLSSFVLLYKQNEFRNNQKIETLAKGIETSIDGNNELKTKINNPSKEEISKILKTYNSLKSSDKEILLGVLKEVSK